LPASASVEVRRQVDELFSPDPLRRANAACELSRLEDAAAPAIPFLVSLLADDLPTLMVRCRVERQMGAWARDFDNRTLDLTQWPPTSPAREAARALSEFDTLALEATLAAEADPIFSVRKYVAWILGDIEDHDERASSALLRLLHDSHPRVRAAAAGGLGQQEAPAAVRPLMTALGDTDAEVRDAAAWALGELEDPAALDTLVDALDDPAPAVRSQAAWALGSLEDPRAASALAALLLRPDADAAVRRQVAWALGSIEDAAGVDGLIRALRDPDPGVRRHAVWALGEIEDARARDALLDAVEQGDSELRRMAIGALAEAVDPNPNPNPRGQLP
jgi:HEAT repeat protein